MKSEAPAYICSHVFERSRPVLLLSHADGDWQCLCGAEHPLDDSPHLVGLNHLIDQDPSLREAMDLPFDWEAERSEIGGTWTRRKIF